MSHQIPHDILSFADQTLNRTATIVYSYSLYSEYVCAFEKMDELNYEPEIIELMKLAEKSVSRFFLGNRISNRLDDFRINYFFYSTDFTTFKTNFNPMWMCPRIR